MVERLPASAPPAPWDCALDGFLWLQRAGGGAAAVLPEPLRHRARVRWVIGGFVRYTASPVGAYSEIYAGLVVRRGLRVVTHIPFLAVDSAESLRGGRANWALPKTLATFRGSPSTSGALRAEGEGWEVGARTRAFGPKLPMRTKLTCAQVRPDGSIATYEVTLAGSTRLALVDVDVRSNASLGTWMPPGRHVASQWSGASLLVGPALPAASDPG